MPFWNTQFSKMPKILITPLALAPKDAHLYILELGLLNLN